MKYYHTAAKQLAALRTPMLSRFSSYLCPNKNFLAENALDGEIIVALVYHEKSLV